MLNTTVPATFRPVGEMTKSARRLELVHLKAARRTLCDVLYTLPRQGREEYSARIDQIQERIKELARSL